MYKYVHRPALVCRSDRLLSVVIHMDPLRDRMVAWHCQADTAQTWLDCRSAVGSSEGMNQAEPTADHLDVILITK